MDQQGSLEDKYARNPEHLLSEILPVKETLEWVVPYLLTKDGAEIDLIIDRPGKPTVIMAIKSGEQVDARDINHLKHFRKDFDNPLSILLSNDETEKTIDGVIACHWTQGINKII